jgi:dihydrofolate synthase/folylpolyglutamate synthase
MAKKEELGRALERLYQRRQFGIKLGLDPVRRMCELLGSPERQYGVIHVAGTNGKGSVSATIASVLQASGLRVGLYTSPHLVRFNERVRVDGVPLPDTDLVDALAACEQAADRVLEEQEHEATFFEITTVLAFECFRRAGVKIAVIETGLGGRLDATNVVTPLLSVITSIAEDHAAHLGDSLEAIAGEKAGIIKEGRPVVSAPQEESAERVLREAAASKSAPFTAAVEAVEIQRISGDLHGQKVRFETHEGLSGTAQYALLGDHQLENLGVAVASSEILFGLLGVPLEPEVLKAGIEQARWPGRLELLKETPCVIADAAHNPAGAAALVSTLKRNGIRHAGVVLGMCDDKDAVAVVSRLSAIASRVWVVPIPDARSMPSEKLAQCVRSFSIDVEDVELEAGLEAAEAWALEVDQPIVITGSIFLLGAVLPRYGAGE